MGKLSRIATFLVLLAAPAAAQPKIVTSFPMLQSLAAAVSGTEPQSIVRGGGSPHTYSMRPSDARALEQADLVIWIGEDYEGFLERPIKALGTRARVLELAEAPGVATLKSREGGVWEGEGHSHAHAGHHHGDVDGHMFLDPKNAAAFGRAIAATLSEIDAPNAQHYRANAEALATKLDALDAELAATLRPLAGKPFIVFHDSLQYLEKRYGLTPAGSITVSPFENDLRIRRAAIRPSAGAYGRRGHEGENRHAGLCRRRSAAGRGSLLHRDARPRDESFFVPFAGVIALRACAITLRISVGNATEPISSAATHCPPRISLRRACAIHTANSNSKCVKP